MREENSHKFNYGLTDPWEEFPYWDNQALDEYYRNQASLHENSAIIDEQAHDLELSHKATLPDRSAFQATQITSNVTRYQLRVQPGQIIILELFGVD